MLMMGFFFSLKKNLERWILDIKPEHRWVRILSNVKTLHFGFSVPNKK